MHDENGHQQKQATFPQRYTPGCLSVCISLSLSPSLEQAYPRMRSCWLD